MAESNLRKMYNVEGWIHVTGKVQRSYEGGSISFAS